MFIAATTAAEEIGYDVDNFDPDRVLNELEPYWKDILNERDIWLLV